jgi:hypothetical protein
LKLLTLLFVVLVGSGLRGQDSNSGSARDFYDKCSVIEKDLTQYDKVDNADALTAGFCMGFAYGFNAGTVSGEVVHKDKAPLFCIPDEVNNLQMVRVARKYIADHPEKENHPIGELFLGAMIHAFPCK